MTIKILASLAMAATLFSACSDNATTPPPSKADQCAAGLSNDCVLGTWSIGGPTVMRTVGTDVVYLIDPSHNFEASPATLKFYVDENKTNTFEFTNSVLSKADCKTATGKTYGLWDIVGTSIHLRARTGNDCMAVSDATIPVDVSVLGGQVTMTLKQIFFMEPEMKQSDAVEKSTATEVYTFVTSN
jgi:hypothetical protein